MIPHMAHNTKKCESITEMGSSKSRVRHAMLLPSFLNSVEVKFLKVKQRQQSSIFKPAAEKHSKPTPAPWGALTPKGSGRSPLTPLLVHAHATPLTTPYSMSVRDHMDFC